MDNSYEIIIKFDDTQNKVFVSASGQGLWADLGLAIEGVGVLMAIERQKFENPKGIKTREELLEYVKKYLEKVSGDYDQSFETLLIKPKL